MHLKFGQRKPHGVRTVLMGECGFVETLPLGVVLPVLEMKRNTVKKV